jgi:hypothetical protein
MEWSASCICCFNPKQTAFSTLYTEGSVGPGAGLGVRIWCEAANIRNKQLLGSAKGVLQVQVGQRANNSSLLQNITEDLGLDWLLRNGGEILHCLNDYLIKCLLHKTIKSSFTPPSYRNPVLCLDFRKYCGVFAPCKKGRDTESAVSMQYTYQQWNRGVTQSVSRLRLGKHTSTQAHDVRLQQYWLGVTLLVHGAIFVTQKYNWVFCAWTVRRLYNATLVRVQCSS